MLKSKLFQILTLICIIALLISVVPIYPERVAHAAAAFYDENILFEANVDGYAQYRIPGVVVTGNGTVISYIEARKTTSDWADIDIFMRRSTDGGNTWEPRVKLVDGVSTANTINNPVMIAEKGTSTVHFLYCKEYNQAFYMKSTDNGATWSAPVEITAVFNQYKTEYNWVCIATGPGHGIQLNNGRLVVPVWLALELDHGPSVVSTIYSDDGGATWNRGEIVWDTPDIWNPNETSPVQLNDGSVMLNIRAGNKRSVSTSLNGSSGWSPLSLKEELTDPNCYGSILRFTDTSGYYNNRLLFTNANNPSDRSNLTVKMSMDEGASWNYSKVLCTDGAAYSDLAVSNDRSTIYCFYEKWNGTLKYHYMVMARFNLEWLTDGEQSLDPLSGPTPTIPPIPAPNVNEQWDSLAAWTTGGTGTKEISPAGQLHLYNNSSSTTYVSRTDISIPQAYTLEFKAKIDDFTSGTIGVSPYPASLATKVSDGKYRLMLDFRTDGIYAIDNYGAWKQVYAVVLDSNWHSWKVAVNQGVAEVFMDGVSQCKFALQSGSYNDELAHWVCGTSTDAVDVHLDYTKLYVEPSVSDSGSIVNFDEHWNSLTAWTTGGTGTKEISPASQLHLYNNSSSTTYVSRKDISIPQAYTLEFKAKIDDFTSGTIGVSPYPASLATKVYDGSYRLMLDFRTDGIYAITNYGSWVKVKDVALDSNWHTYMVVVDNGVACLYMDYVYQCKFLMQAGAYTDELAHWVLGTSTDPVNTHVEYTRLYKDLKSSGPVAYWNLNETSGTTAADSSGNTNTGTVSGAVWSAGKINNGLNFDGVNDWVDAANKSSLQFATGDFTAAAWVKADNVSDRFLFWYGEVGADVPSWWVRLSSGKVSFQVDGTSAPTGNYIETDTAVVGTGVWKHIAVTRRYNLLRIYVDGAETKSISLSNVPNLSSIVSGLSIGKDKNGTTRYFDGMMDEVRVYDRALSTNELKALCNQ